MLNCTTVSETIYDDNDELDTGATHASALEIRLKMKSRQIYNMFSLDPFAPFTLDEINVCAEINEKAYQWALDNADPRALARFNMYGTRMVFAPDYFYPLPIGPLWIDGLLRMKLKKVNNERVLWVQSISMKTSADNIFNVLHPDAGGQHYCKLLSPARAMEWIYTDGLRNRLTSKA
jgi:hypothetical protein